MKRLKPLALQRNIELIFESFRPVTAEIDEVKLSLGLTNLIENGIKAIWNFAHIDLETPEDVIVENVHHSESLMTLSYNLSQYRQEHVEEQQS